MCPSPEPPPPDFSDDPVRIGQVYDDLRRIAADFLHRQPAGHTLQPTALVHEAYLKLARGAVQWASRTHFVCTAVRAMRQILVDHARRAAAAKRGGTLVRITLDESTPEPGGDVDLLILNDALESLGQLDKRKARVVELRVFGGLTTDEASVALGVSEVTIRKDWRFARAWLAKELYPGLES